MSREQIWYEIPEEWKENRAKGLCPVCAKHRKDFDKFKRVYCSDKCTKEYNSKIFTWGEVRAKTIVKHKSTCNNCGVNRKNLEQKKDELLQKDREEWIKDNKEPIELIRRKKLDEVEKLYKKALAPVSEFVKEYSYDLKEFGLPHEWDNKYRIPFSIEVDHIHPVGANGHPYDQENLQVLCKDCHKKKTKQDLKTIKKFKNNQEDLLL